MAKKAKEVMFNELTLMYIRFELYNFVNAKLLEENSFAAFHWGRFPIYEHRPEALSWIIKFQETYQQREKYTEALERLRTKCLADPTESNINMIIYYSQEMGKLGHQLQELLTKLRSFYHGHRANAQIKKRGSKTYLVIMPTSFLDMSGEYKLQLCARSDYDADASESKYEIEVTKPNWYGFNKIYWERISDYDDMDDEE